MKVLLGDQMATGNRKKDKTYLIFGQKFLPTRHPDGVQQFEEKKQKNKRKRRNESMKAT